jgi:DNA polymerase-1
VFLEDLSQAFTVEKPIPPLPFDPEKYRVLTDFEEALSFLRSLIGPEAVSFDYETIGLSPHHRDGGILTIAAMRADQDVAACVPIHKDDLWTEQQLMDLYFAWAQFLRSNTPKIVQNERFEQIWSRVVFGTRIEGEVWDTRLAAHIIDYRRGTTSLEFLAFCHFGYQYKDMVSAAKLAEEKLEKVAKYNCIDVAVTLHLKHDQTSAMQVGRLRDAHRFFQRTKQVLFNLEERGLYIDGKALQELDLDTCEHIGALQNALDESPPAYDWLDQVGEPLNIESNPQLAHLLYDLHGWDSPKGVTAAGNRSVDSESLEMLLTKSVSDELRPFLERLLLFRRYQKTKTYIDNWAARRDKHGFVHPCYSLAVADTYRSSCSDPNAQNIPVRNDLQKQIRRCIQPVNDVFLEVDYSGCEVRVIAMYSRDETLIQEIMNHIDTHRNWATRLYEKPADDISKLERYRAKNAFVFPEFYGSWWKPVAQHLGLPESHVKDVEEEFWKSYAGVRAWQKRLMAGYEKYGYIETNLGFRYYAPLRANKIINSPIQGTAFHLCLDGLHRADEEMTRREMRSFVNLEVHDSGLVDLALDETEDVVELLSRHLLSKRFDWQINVPLEVEWKLGRDLLSLEKVEL